jgi:hypothetical protein
MAYGATEIAARQKQSSHKVAKLQRKKGGKGAYSLCKIYALPVSKADAIFLSGHSGLILKLAFPGLTKHSWYTVKCC